MNCVFQPGDIAITNPGVALGAEYGVDCWIADPVVVLITKYRSPPGLVGEGKLRPSYWVLAGDHYGWLHEFEMKKINTGEALE